MAEYDLVIGVSLHLGQRRGDFRRRDLCRLLIKTTKALLGSNRRYLRNGRWAPDIDSRKLSA